MCKDINNKVVYNRDTKQHTCEGTEYKKALTHWIYVGRDEQLGERTPPKHIQILAKWIRTAYSGDSIDIFEEEKDWSGLDNSKWYQMAEDALAGRVVDPWALKVRHGILRSSSEEPIEKERDIPDDAYSNLSYSDLLLRMAGKLVRKPILPDVPLPEGFEDIETDNRDLQTKCDETNERLVESNLNIPEPLPEEDGYSNILNRGEY